MPTNTIPASQTVNIIPAVLAAGGQQLTFIELMLTTNSRVPIGTVPSFANLAGVQSYFGPTSNEAAAAAVYFLAFDNSNIKPGALLFAQYPIVNVGAYLRGGNISTITLAALQALTGTLTVTIDGVVKNSGTVNLSSATSFTSASQLIANGFALTGPTLGSVTASAGATFTATGSSTNLTVTAVTGVIVPGTAASCSITGTGVPSSTYIISQTSGTTGGAGVYVTNNATTSSAASITATSTTMTVSAVGSGTVAVGDQATGSGVTTGTYIGGLGTGSGGTGTYILTQGMQFASTTVTLTQPVVTWDSVSGAFIIISSTTGATSTMSFATGTLSASLALTQALGAVTSQGAVTATPSAFMAGIIQTTQNWVTFQTLFDPDAGSGNAQKQLFAAWTNSTGNQFAYLAWDNDITPVNSNAATTSLGYILRQAQSSGTVPIYEQLGVNNHYASFVGGAIASVDFSEHNGRTNLKFRSQSGLPITSLTGTQAANLDANGYNYYAGNASRAQQFNWLAQGVITGPFDWIDTYIDQIWLNYSLQEAFLLCLTQNKSVPYNATGYSLLRQYAQDPINAALNFGAIVTGVPLSEGQAAYVNNAAGFRISDTITQNGYYLLILPSSPTVRGLRGSPPMQFFYTDGGSVNMINLTSTDIM